VATKSKTVAPADQPETAHVTFEDAMRRLETIVETMEAGDVPLANLLAKYEEGTRLLTQCEQRLKAAELKIEQLKRQKDGTLSPAPFPAADRADLDPT
jgi:exodeoxyribonuclease VII small subunit